MKKRARRAIAAAQEVKRAMEGRDPGQQRCRAPGDAEPRAHSARHVPIRMGVITTSEAIKPGATGSTPYSPRRLGYEGGLLGL